MVGQELDAVWAAVGPEWPEGESVSRTYDQHGEVCTYVTAYWRRQFPGLSPEQIIAAMNWRYEPTHCTHSYDCCGHWYRHSFPEVAFDGDLIRVTDTLYRNV